MLDFDAIRARHRLREVAERCGYWLPDRPQAMISCPMPGHADRTPSMIVHLDSDRFHCFGCGAHGDVVQWVRDVYGVSVTEAARMLDTSGPLPPLQHPPTARQAVPVSPADRAEPDRTPACRVQAALYAAWAHNTEREEHDAAVEYLVGRGIDVQALEKQLDARVVGHTPTGSAHRLSRQLCAEGFTPDELVDAGLARRSGDGRIIDAYRDRVILPVCNADGGLVGLIGRYVGDERPNVPKYLNPTLTATYDKSRDLYRPDVAWTAPDANVVVVEGTLDALAIAARAAQDGRSAEYAPVSASGTRLSDAHIAAILAIDPHMVVLAADGDQAGAAANLRWNAQFLAAGRETVATTFPEHLKDPAAWLAAHSGPDGLAAITRRGCMGGSGLRPRHLRITPTEPDRNLIEAQRVANVLDYNCPSRF